jgi:hypothetical protein
MTSDPQPVPSRILAFQPRRRPHAAGDEARNRRSHPSLPLHEQAKPSAPTTDARKAHHSQNDPPLFSTVCALLCEPPRKIRPLFCYSCALLRPQAPCFDNHASCPRCFFPRDYVAFSTAPEPGAPISTHPGSRKRRALNANVGFMHKPGENIGQPLHDGANLTSG